VPSLAAAVLLAALPSLHRAAAHLPQVRRTRSLAVAAYAQLPLAFEPNSGQTARQVDFVRAAAATALT
jgi:hypothetical protein